MSEHSESDGALEADFQEIRNGLAEEISNLRSDLDRIVPHVINSLRRDEEEHRNRVKNLERQSESLPTWPFAISVHRFLERMRHTEMPQELAASIQEELGGFLRGQGFRPFGKTGQKFDPNQHEPVGKSGTDSGPWVIDDVVMRGLRWTGLVVQRAVVTVTKDSMEEMTDER